MVLPHPASAMSRDVPDNPSANEPRVRFAVVSIACSVALPDDRQALCVSIVPCIYTEGLRGFRKLQLSNGGKTLSSAFWQWNRYVSSLSFAFA